MENLLHNLKALLQKDERLVSEGELLKNKIIELGLKLDKNLIKLLLSDKKMKEVFFADIRQTLVFDKEKFIRFVSNKQFLPDSYTGFKNKIGLTVKDEYLSEKKEVVLSWPYKDCVLEGGMTKEDQKRNEIFWNEILAPDEISRLLDPKVFTNAKRIDKKGEHKLNGFRTDENGNIKDNLIIKGNNLLALHSLKKRFAGKVKLIYIDPPYNREADAFYNDSFKHSTWLTFMKNRLEIARDLLKEEGIIFVQCDDSEQAYLKVLMDEVFGRNNFLNQISWERSAVAGLGQGASFAVNVTEWIIVYAKDRNYLTVNTNYVFKKKYPFEKLRGYSKILVNAGKKKLIESLKSKSSGKDVKIYKHFKYKVENINFSKLSQKDINNIYSKNFNIIFRPFLVQKENKFQHSLIKKMDRGLYSVEYIPSRGKNAGKRTTLFYWNKELVAFLKNSAAVQEGKVIKLENPNDFWTRDEISNAARGEGGIKGLDRTKKPEILMQRIIEWTATSNDIVLDFFMGTGTTCAVAHKMGRQYIGIEQLDYGENSAEVRLKNVVNGDPTGISKSVGWKGGGDFVYLELMKWNENFVDRIQKAKTKADLKKLWKIMKKKAFLSYKVEPKVIDGNAKDFADLSLEGQKQFLLECLDKNHLYINYSEIDDEDYGVSKGNKKLNKEFYKSL
ncbi:MAG: DNA methyltransferase [Candidatus Nealsonbacteria bacterium]